MRAEVVVHVNQFDCLLRHQEGYFQHGIGFADEGNDHAVVVAVGGVVEQAHLQTRILRLQHYAADLLDDLLAPPLAEVGHTFD